MQIHYLNEICTILKPTFDDNGKIVYEDFGDCFYKLRRGAGEKYIPGTYTHKALIEMNGVRPGDVLITPQHDYVVVSIQDNVLGLVVKT